MPQNPDRYELFLESEIAHAEREKEHCVDGHMRMAFVGQIAAFKGALVCYRKIKYQKKEPESVERTIR